MGNPGAIAKLAQPIRRRDPELAARALGHVAIGGLRAGNDIDFVTIQLDDACPVEESRENFAVGADGCRSAFRTGKSVGDLEDAPIGSALAGGGLRQSQAGR